MENCKNEKSDKRLNESERKKEKWCKKAKESKNEKKMNFQGKGLVFTLRQYAQSISRIKYP